MTPTKLTKVKADKMTKSERILIGSSNVANFYLKADFDEYPEYQMTKCTRFNSFKIQMKNLEKENKLVVISVIENFLADAAKQSEAQDPNNYATNFNETIATAIQDFVNVVKDFRSPHFCWSSQFIDHY
jgi:hypothetical protein